MPHNHYATGYTKRNSTDHNDTKQNATKHSNKNILLSVVGLKIIRPSAIVLNVITMTVMAPSLRRGQYYK